MDAHREDGEAGAHKGTKELLSRYGASLLCVRYRYDEDAGAISPVLEQ